jgi:hypothetical protein
MYLKKLKNITSKVLYFQKILVPLICTKTLTKKLTTNQ